MAKTTLRFKKFAFDPKIYVSLEDIVNYLEVNANEIESFNPTVSESFRLAAADFAVASTKGWR